MLTRLSGRKHRVITGLALYHAGSNRMIADYEITYVVFRALDPAAIAAYLDGHAYLDKAGSYAVQEIGPAFVERIDGDYDNVVGLPVGRLKRMLKEWSAPEWTIDVTGIDFASGWAMGFAEGGAVLVPGALPGDRVRGPPAAAQAALGQGPGGRVALARPGRGALPPFRQLRRLRLPEPGLRPPARAQGGALPRDDFKRLRPRPRPRRLPADPALARALRIPQQDGVRLRRRGGGGQGGASRPIAARSAVAQAHGRAGPLPDLRRCGRGGLPRRTGLRRCHRSAAL